MKKVFLKILAASLMLSGLQVNQIKSVDTDTVIHDVVIGVLVTVVLGFGIRSLRNMRTKNKFFDAILDPKTGTLRTKINDQVNKQANAILEKQGIELPENFDLKQALTTDNLKKVVDVVQSVVSKISASDIRLMRNKGEGYEQKMADLLTKIDSQFKNDTFLKTIKENPRIQKAIFDTFAKEIELTSEEITSFQKFLKEKRLTSLAPTDEEIATYESRYEITKTSTASIEPKQSQTSIALRKELGIAENQPSSVESIEDIMAHQGFETPVIGSLEPTPTSNPSSPLERMRASTTAFEGSRVSTSARSTFEKRPTTEMLRYDI